MILRTALIGALLCSTAPVWAQDVDDNAPLSAIDWLSESVEQPATVAVGTPVLGTQPTRDPVEGEDPVANSASTPSVSVQPLSGAAPRVLGLLTPASTGLQADLWENSDADTLIALMSAERMDSLPALQDLLTTLILTQANPPLEGADMGSFFLARVDRLLSFGALEEAQAMLEAATPDTDTLFRRWFDVSLLTGTEDTACRSLRNKPDVAPTPSARIFCLARSGDWSAAALTLNTGLALGDIDEDTGDLLSRFLDPDLYEGEPPLARPTRTTPLNFRMFEAIGDPLSTQNLPLAFAHSDLRENVGWKAQLEAAERLARAGSIDSNVLISLYTARVPAASGGVWERAKAVQRMNDALVSGDEDAVADALNRLWDEAESVGVLLPLAQVFGPQLLSVDVGPAGRETQFKMMLLSDVYENAALDETLAATDPFLAAIARGLVDGADDLDVTNMTVLIAFLSDPDMNLIEMSDDGRTGEAILRAMSVVEQGISGDAQAFQDGIATLRGLGLEDVARRTALQYILLDR